MLTGKDIHAFLRENGIKPDDKITVHAALRAVGKIENGADGRDRVVADWMAQGLDVKADFFSATELRLAAVATPA